LQRTQGGRKINIVHIGDSHILGNFLTREVRERMQRAFGDAGRGLLFPYRLADSNGPKDFMVETNARWSGTNCVRDQSAVADLGLAGFSAITTNSKGELTFRLRDTATLESKMFTKVTVFYRNDAKGFDFTLGDDVTGQQADPIVEDELSKSFYFDRPVGEFTLRTTQAAGQKNFHLDGVCLENELAGVIYHSIGVNGAKYSDFARSKYFARQLRDLTPDLVILSFGTNEGQANPNSALLRRQMDDLTQQILTQWPHAQILLTTPADSYLRGKGFNPHLAEVSRCIGDFARAKNFALWDLYNLSGGQNSAESWKSRGLMSSDSVHYSKAGYAVQGKLLYQSLIKSYNSVAARRVAAARR
jgi:lysophospholipase L1-like esterase